MTKILDSIKFRLSSESVEVNVQVFKEIEGEGNETFIEFEVIEFGEYGNTRQKIKFKLTKNEFQKFINTVQEKVNKIEEYYNLIKEKMYEIK